MELQVKLTTAEVERILAERVTADLGLQDYTASVTLSNYGATSVSFAKPVPAVPVPVPSPVGGVV